MIWLAVTLTIRIVGTIDIHVKLFISFQSLLQQGNLLFALNPTSGGIGTALLIALHLVKLDHFLNAFEVLLFNIDLELNLGQHKLDAGTEVRGIIFDQICRGQMSAVEPTSK